MYRRFKVDNFDLDDKERPGQSKRFENEGLETFMDEDSCQTLQKLEDVIENDLSSASKRLKHQKRYKRHSDGKLYFPCHIFLALLHLITTYSNHWPMVYLSSIEVVSIEGVKKWVDLWITSKDESFFCRENRLMLERWENVVDNDG